MVLHCVLIQQSRVLSCQRYYITRMTGISGIVPLFHAGIAKGYDEAEIPDLAGKVAVVRVAWDTLHAHVHARRSRARTWGWAGVRLSCLRERVLRWALHDSSLEPDRSHAEPAPRTGVCRCTSHAGRQRRPPGQWPRSAKRCRSVGPAA